MSSGQITNKKYNIQMKELENAVRLKELDNEVRMKELDNEKEIKLKEKDIEKEIKLKEKEIEKEIKLKEKENEKSCLVYASELYDKYGKDKDILVRQPITDYFLNYVAGKTTVSEDKIFYTDLAAILQTKGLKTHSPSGCGRYISNRYRETYGKECTKSKKICNGAHRYTNSYTEDEISFVIKHAKEYIEKNENNNKKNENNNKKNSKNKGNPWANASKKKSSPWS